MTGPEHFAKAEEHLALADGRDDSMSAWHQRQAQVHATLALAAGDADDWDYAAAAGLTGGVKP